MPEIWFKILEQLTSPRISPRLERRIHEEILLKAEQFTKEKAEDFTEGLELFGQLIVAHQDYKAKHGAFGDMFGDYLNRTDSLWRRNGQFLTPMNIAKFMVELTLGELKDGKPQKILDPAAGTGRFMLMTAKHYADTIGKLNFLFFNIDIDFTVYVYCAMNAILNGIPALTILGDSLAYRYSEGIATIPIGPAAMWKVIDAEKLKKIMGTKPHRFEVKEAMRLSNVTPEGNFKQLTLTELCSTSR